MEKIVQTVISSIVMGLLLPRLLVSLGGGSEPGTVEPTEPTQSTVATQPAPQEPPVQIPVLLENDRIVILELEEYVRGVVLAEMPASFEEEALKAQAVVARTYALCRLQEGDRHRDFAICADPGCCQAYVTDEQYVKELGTHGDIDRITAMVAATKCLVLTYEGELAEATYFSCSGGRTEDAQAVWGADIPYLQAVPSPGEEDAPIYYKEVRFTREELSALLGRTLQGTPASWLGKISYTPGGGVAAMTFAGMRYTGVELRSLLGLFSTAFTVTAGEDGITVSTLGRGHRVGMSQYGADAMAVAGSSFEEILMYYYGGTRIDKLTDLG